MLAQHLTWTRFGRFATLIWVARASAGPARVSEFSAICRKSSAAGVSGPALLFCSRHQLPPKLHVDHEPHPRACAFGLQVACAAAPHCCYDLNGAFGKSHRLKRRGFGWSKLSSDVASTFMRNARSCSFETANVKGGCMLQGIKVAGASVPHRRQHGCTQTQRASNN